MSETSQGGTAQFCGQCGAALLPDAKFCATCGATVQPGAVSTASKSTATPQAKSGSRLWLAVVAGVILVGVLAVAFLLNQQKQPAAAIVVQSTAPAQQDIPYPGVARVSPGEAHAAANAGQAVIVDVRDRESYDQAHIAGAISIPENELAARSGELPQDRQILTYCT